MVLSSSSFAIGIFQYPLFASKCRKDDGLYNGMKTMIQNKKYVFPTVMKFSFLESIQIRHDPSTFRAENTGKTNSHCAGSMKFWFVILSSCLAISC